jgi:hypothetical protein
MSAAARSFIRAPGADPNSGWELGGSRGSERMAALLCFDEMQVGRVCCTYRDALEVESYVLCLLMTAAVSCKFGGQKHRPPTIEPVQLVTGPVTSESCKVWWVALLALHATTARCVARRSGTCSVLQL